MSDAGLFGPRLGPDGVTFRLWAPAAHRVELLLDRAREVPRRADGWYELTVPGAGAGTLYKFAIDGELEVPDPASAFQPHDVHGPSEVVAHDFDWQATAWRGRPWHEAVFLELHVGSFTPAGTFRSAIDKLDKIIEFGATAIELMPIADFAGSRNWGYDGVLPFAPDSRYGRPEDLKALIDACHARGLMVFLDVVYNHFGPEGNYLGRYAPAFFTAAQTPWGSAIDYRVPQARAFAIENALHWLRHYRFDGLRLDAVHAIVEPGQPSVLADLSGAVGRLAAATGRAIHLVLENHDNCAEFLDPSADPPRGRYRAQWSDDYHRAWHVLLTGETGGTYRNYAGHPHLLLARALSAGFAFQDEPSPQPAGMRRTEPSGGLSPAAFVVYLQNHDQIGNRPRGDRLTELAPAAAIEAALAVTLLAPMPPLLFMGEEWGSTQPFPFFCDFRGDLAQAVRNGRDAELKEIHGHANPKGPDPLAEETFRSAVLDWDACDRDPHRRRLDFVRRLLTLRRREIAPRLVGMRGGTVRAEADRGVITAEWRMGDGSRLLLLANLNSNPVARHVARHSAPGRAAPHRPRPHGRPIWGGAPGAELAPWAVHWALTEG
jgi:malto-oligosyltrehalose trehalohydrolase